VAWAGTLTGAARHDNLKRRSPDLTAFTGGGVGGFLRFYNEQSLHQKTHDLTGNKSQDRV